MSQERSQNHSSDHPYCQLHILSQQTSTAPQFQLAAATYAPEDSPHINAEQCFPTSLVLKHTPQQMFLWFWPIIRPVLLLSLSCLVHGAQNSLNHLSNMSMRDSGTAKSHPRDYTLLLSVTKISRPVDETVQSPPQLFLSIINVVSLIVSPLQNLVCRGRHITLELLTATVFFSQPSYSRT
jgi:hypothetical protein